MIFGKGECRRTRRTSNENLTKSAKIAAFWQGSFYSWLAYRIVHTLFRSAVGSVYVRRCLPAGKAAKSDVSVSAVNS